MKALGLTNTVALTLAALRFWGKVDKSAGPDQCWPWTAGHLRDREGRFRYGMFAINRCNIGAHRMAWFYTFGEIETDLCVCHHCDNMRCCNPAHMFLGTSKDNYVDMVSKGRQFHNRGTKHGMAKLTEAQVLEIRACTDSSRAMAPRYGISFSNVISIKARKSWGWL